MQKKTAGTRKLRKDLPVIEELFRTPPGTAGWCHLDKPDKYSDKYDAEICFEDHRQIQEIVDCLQRIGDENELEKMPFYEDEDGRACLKARSKYAPGIVDAEGKTCKAPWKGATIRLAFKAVCYDAAGQIGSGVSLRLVKVQVLKQAEGGGSRGEIFDKMDPVDWSEPPKERPAAPTETPEEESDNVPF